MPTTVSRNCSSELASFRFAIRYCCRATSIFRSRISGCENATSSPDWRLGSKLFSGLLLVVRAASHETLHVPLPHGTCWRTPVVENQSRVSTPLLPSSELIGGVDVAGSRERGREHRRIRGAALADLCRLDFGVEPNDREIRIVVDGAADRLVQRQGQ